MTSSSPVNLLGYQQARLARLEWAVGVLSLSVLLLVSLGTWYVWHGLPVYFVPPSGPGIARPGVIPDDVALDYASRVLRARYTFTPATIKGAHAAMLSTLHPTLLVAFHAQAEREVALVKEHQLSAQVAITAASITQRTATEVLVSLDAIRSVWVGSQQVRDEAVQAQMTVRSWLTHGELSGLAVSRMTITPAFSASGR